jgi:hypothetical protein
MVIFMETGVTDMTDFHDDGDELAKLFGGATDTTPARPIVAPPASYKPMDYSEPCSKCRGSGRYGNFGSCFACNGKGKKTFKTAPEARARVRASTAKRAATRAQDIAARAEAFKAAHPEVAAWIVGSPGFPFAVAMADALAKYGSLTPNQLAACERCVTARANARTAATERVAAAPAITVAKIEEAFTAAREAGKKRLLLRLDTFEFKPAGATSANAGAIYVTEAGAYLGKITGGKFICTRECGDDRQARVLTAAADPKAAAVAFGKRTGSCSCCGRELTNAESIELGIGPICASKWGW